MKIALEEHLREETLALGAGYFGIADLSCALESVEEQGGQMMAQFPHAISIGVAMPFAIVDQLPRHEEKAVALAYRSHSYDIINFRLDQIASRLASTLQRAGYRAFPVRASQVVDEERLYGLFSHKLAAHLAGLGWIGKSCLLVTPEVGPRVRWASILTDAPLAAGQPLPERADEPIVVAGNAWRAWRPALLMLSRAGTSRPANPAKPVSTSSNATSIPASASPLSVVCVFMCARMGGSKVKAATEKISLLVGWGRANIGRYAESSKLQR